MRPAARISLGAREGDGDGTRTSVELVTNSSEAPSRRYDSYMALEFTTSCLADAVSLFRYYKKLGEGAIAQLNDEQIYATLDREMNSVAVIIKHLSGNMRSRWTGFPDADG